jgi:hypothetical protein
MGSISNHFITSRHFETMLKRLMGNGNVSEHDRGIGMCLKNKKGNSERSHAH